MTRILLIEDDATIADGIVKGLSQQNMMVDWFADAKLGEMAIHEGVFDAVLLDLTLPRGDGMTILANWRHDRFLPRTSRQISCSRLPAEFLAWCACRISPPSVMAYFSSSAGEGFLVRLQAGISTISVLSMG